MDRRLLREINRLFDELVHDPWRRVPPAAAARSELEGSVRIEIPLKGSQVERIALTTDGQRLTVTLSTVRDQHLGGGLATRKITEQYQQTFGIPDGTTPAGFEARFEADALHLRIGLRRRDA